MLLNEEKKILEVARGYIGEHEIAGNKGFVNPNFEEQMRMVKWVPPFAWCSFFVMLVWRMAYAQLNSIIEADLRILISPSATQTYNNFTKSKEYKQYVSKIPKPGALMVFQYGDTWRGHIGVVEKLLTDDWVIDVEGNTNSKGGREGLEVARIKREVDFTFKKKGLHLIGFVHPPAIKNHVVEVTYL